MAATSGWPDGVRQGCLGKKLRKKKATGPFKNSRSSLYRTCPGMVGIMGIKMMMMMIPDLFQHFPGIQPCPNLALFLTYHAGVL